MARSGSQELGARQLPYGSGGSLYSEVLMLGS